MPKVNQKLSGKTKNNMFNFEIPEALKKPLDLMYSNMRGALFVPETRFCCSERGANKETEATAKAKVRAVGKIGGAEAGVSAGRCLV